MEELNRRITDYWTKRAGDFAQVRREELEDSISMRWIAELKCYLPEDGQLKILDAGTGTGYFAIMLAALGHNVTAIDLTPAMIHEARELAAEQGLAVDFRVMDAQQLEFPDATFDRIVTRNLTWTLPQLEQAYQEWFRVLRPGGIVVNFDAAYGQEVLQQDEEISRTAYKHIGMTKELLKESDLITKAVPVSWKNRPEWDMELLGRAGFTRCSCDRDAGNRILKEKNGEIAPLFQIVARK